MNTITSTRYLITLCLLLAGISLSLQAQNFVNGDLNGAISTSIPPTGWQFPLYTDPLCQATSWAQTTSDVTGLAGPSAGGGLNGNPFSGLTFVSGLHAHMPSLGLLWHEGLQQTVSGFTIGATYNITFWQSVVKQINCLDPSGTWSVYADNTLLGQTAPTNSLAPFNSNSFVWERRTITFTATAASHTFKFFPTDDDPVIVGDPECLRMGIDSINISAPIVLPAPIAFDVFEEEGNVQVEWNSFVQEGILSYHVERSANGLDFDRVNTQPAYGPGLYQYEDESPLPGLSWYRLGKKMEDGSVSWSDVKSVLLQPEVNIFVSQFNLFIQDGTPGQFYQVSLFDLTGKQVFFGDVEQHAELSGLTSGSYLLKAVPSDPKAKTITKKVMVGF